MNENLTTLMGHIGHHFSDEKWLFRALCHRSMGQPNNERLEFLGDAILGMIIAEILFEHHPKADEGELSRMRSFLVNGDHLSGLAKELNLSAYIHLGVGEMKSGGQHRESILSDALEALIGAIYLDSDMATCRSCIVKWYGQRIDDLGDMKSHKDAKSRLQEWGQAHKFPLPIYELSMSGKPHEPVFSVVCRIDGLPDLGQGMSSSRRKAEQIAAQHYLDLLK